jgi:hypothetical protein
MFKKNNTIKILEIKKIRIKASQTKQIAGIKRKLCVLPVALAHQLLFHLSSTTEPDAQNEHLSHLP